MGEKSGNKYSSIPKQDGIASPEREALCVGILKWFKRLACEEQVISSALGTGTICFSIKGERVYGNYRIVRSCKFR